MTAKDDRGYIVETVCAAHAKALITDRIEALHRFVYDATGKPIAKITVEWLCE